MTYQIRSQRLRVANEKGSHSKKEWQEMKDFFENTCAKCYGESGLEYVERDHIIPIYQGGSNHIRNIQPLCARCNASKGSDNSDLRPFLCDYLQKELPEIYSNPF